MPVSEIFGFLNHPHTIEFDGGRIVPTDSFQQGLEFINKFGNKDGYFYPGLIRTCTKSLESDQVEYVSNTERPASVFDLPESHVLYIESPLNGENSRYEDAGLLIHLLGFLFGVRLQFSDWRFDGKVPIERQNRFQFADEVPSIFISHVYNKWKILDPKLRKLYINILYMHGKAKSYEWHWDKFIYQYMVFDAIYNLATEGQKIKGVTHEGRFKYLCDNFSIDYVNEAQFKEIYDLRNDLFHEGLWDGGMPGLSQQNRDNSFRNLNQLDRLNSRLIVEVSGYNISEPSCYWSLGLEPFDPR
jgi:hypothetical protein